MVWALLALLAGATVGLVLGLTGVGSVFAVPILVYGFGLGAHTAVCAAMVAIAVMTLTASLRGSRRHLVVVPLGAVVATFALMGAVAGVWLNKQFRADFLLVNFGIVAAIIGIRMLLAQAPSCLDQIPNAPAPIHFPAMISIGLAAGIVSGLLGISGGVLIIPGLVFFGRVSVQRAIATSLPIVTLVSAVTIAGHYLAGQRWPMAVTVLFATGGLGGLEFGTFLGSRLNTETIRKSFATAVLATAVFLIWRNL